MESILCVHNVYHVRNKRLVNYSVMWIRHFFYIIYVFSILVCFYIHFVSVFFFIIYYNIYDIESTILQVYSINAMSTQSSIYVIPSVNYCHVHRATISERQSLLTISWLRLPYFSQQTHF